MKLQWPLYGLDGKEMGKILHQEKDKASLIPACATAIFPCSCQFFSPSQNH